MQVRIEVPYTLNELFEDVFAPRTEATTVPPAMDVAELPTETIVLAEVPGVKKEDIRMTVEDGVLTSRADRKPDQAPEGGKVIFAERTVAGYERKLRLPHDVDNARIDAELHNGILKIVLPKAEHAKARTIEIR